MNLSPDDLPGVTPFSHDSWFELGLESWICATLARFARRGGVFSHISCSLLSDGSARFVSCWRGFSVHKCGSVFRFARFASEFCAVNLEPPASVRGSFFLNCELPRRFDPQHHYVI